MVRKHTRVIALVATGNILDYYDFMLFAHLGATLTAVFFPKLAPTETHLLGLLLFAIPFIVRPFGGYFFGKLSDTIGRGYALGQTLKYASFASLGIALLPGFEKLGWVSIIGFIMFRALQGLSLGGEYTTAGTVLMEKYSKHQGLLSGIVGASGTVGSLFAFGFSWFYLKDYFSADAWRIAFAVGAGVTYLSYYFREKLKKEMTSSAIIPALPYNISVRRAMLIVTMIGFYIGVIIWYPMIYANFYLTKILHYPASTGLIATLIALVGSIVLTPIAGHLADRFRPERVMTIGALLSIPLCLAGFYLLQHGIVMGQLLTICAVALFGGPMHAVMNPLFAPEHRSRYVNTCFMLGASLGSLVPSISGFFAKQYAFYYAPSLFLTTLGCATFYLFVTSFRSKNMLLAY